MNIYVSNLSFNVQDEDLRGFFEDFGEVTSAKVITDKETGRSRGFGFVEIGTVTPKAQAGNDKPRLFRLPKDKALINRMGFNNDGVKVIAERLQNWKENRNSKFAGPSNTAYNSKLIIGGNIGKNKIDDKIENRESYEVLNPRYRCDPMIDIKMLPWLTADPLYIKATIG